MTAPAYEFLEHTADAGIVAHGSTLAALLASAAAGMYALMVDPAGVAEREERTVAVTAASLEGLLEAWLLDLLFLTETAGLVFRRFAVAVEGEWALRASAWGERYDPARHAAGVVVKAVTHHDLRVTQDAAGWHARVLFDI